MPCEGKETHVKQRRSSPRLECAAVGRPPSRLQNGPVIDHVFCPCFRVRTVTCFPFVSGSLRLAFKPPRSRTKDLTVNLSGLHPTRNMAAPYQYAPSNLDHVEDLEKYQRNGFHPVHLGDKLDKFDAERYRYEVIHKLGNGGFATVWLAHDIIDGGYVALKIVHASQSSYGAPPTVESILDDHPTKIFVTERRRFFISGPNGHHVCQVLPVTGPSLMALSRPPYRLQPAVCKTLAQQAAQALEFLHARGLCHGGTSCCPRSYVGSE